MQLSGISASALFSGRILVVSGIPISGLAACPQPRIPKKRKATTPVALV
jgi:hypothetical protein